MNSGNLLKVLCLATVLLVPAMSAFGQDARGRERVIGEVLEIDTRLIDVPIVVTGPSGRPVSGLTRDNFEIFEDGKLQTIDSFAATAAPFEVALLLDTSGSTRSDLRLIVRAAEYFIRSLRDGDRVAILAYNQKRSGRRVEAYSEILSDLSEDKNGLVKSLSHIGVSNGTPFYDSLLMAARDVFGSPPAKRFRGRRALVALTDGVDSTSFWNFKKADRALERSGVVTYFIKIDTREKFEQNLLGDCSTATHLSDSQIKRYYDLFTDNSKMEKVFDFCKIGDFSRLDMSRRLYGLAGDEMETLAERSGGKVFPASDIREAATAFGEVAAEIGSKYSIGYYPTNDRADGGYRRIIVRLKGVPAGCKVRAREGYAAPERR